MSKARVDRLLVAQGLARTRSQAQELVERGLVTAGGKRIDKSGALLPEDIELRVDAPLRFVSRGGDKLDGAIDDLHVDVAGAVCVDVGASTGGFTDCLLGRGALKVYAVDVGTDLLAEPLRSDPRVVVRENVNAKNLERDDFEEPLDLAVVDASFIGVEKLLPALSRILPAGARLLVLIKPQFQVGRDEARRIRGVVKDRALRERAIDDARASVDRAGFEIAGGCDSRVPGRRGNVEYFLLAVRRG